MSAKTAGKCFLDRVPDDVTNTLEAKNLIEIALCLTISKIIIMIISIALYYN